MADLTRRDQLAAMLMCSLGSRAGLGVYVAAANGPVETSERWSVRLADRLMRELDRTAPRAESAAHDVPRAYNNQSALRAVLGDYGPHVEAYVVGTMRQCGELAEASPIAQQILKTKQRGKR